MSATNRIFIPFGEFKPDAGSFLSNGLVVANGCVPTGDKFLPTPGMAIRSDSISSNVLAINRAHVNVNPPSGSPKIYVLNGSTMYVVDTGTTPWSASALTVSGGFTVGTSADAGDIFSFGQHEIWTQGLDNEIMYRAAGAGNITALITPTAAPAAYSTRPRAKFGCAIGDRVLFGYIKNGTLATADPAVGALMSPNPDPDMLWWTKTRDASVLADENHPLDGRSGYTFLRDNHGPLMGLSGDKEYALAFKKRAIYRIDFTGAFGNTYRCIPQSYGTISHRTICRLGNDVYFWSDAGPCVYRNDQVYQLSAGRLSSFFSGITLYSVSAGVGPFYGASVDLANQTVSWLYSYTGDDGATIRFSMLTYNAQLDLFSVPLDMSFGPSCLWFDADESGTPATPYVLFDGLPSLSPQAAFMGSVMLCDTYSPDELRLATFGTDLAKGSTTRWWDQDTTFRTGFYALGEQNYVLVKKIRPVIRATSEAALPDVSVKVLSKDKPWSDPSDSGYKALSTAGDDRGFISTLGAKPGQFQQFELLIPRRSSATQYASDVNEIEGIEVEFEVKAVR